MLLQIMLFFVGLGGLYFGAEWLVRGASRFARSFNIKPVVIGLTIVAFGTSTPELVTSVMAGIKHLSDIAMGNIIGSNIANIGLILGLSALVRPLSIDMKLLYREMPIVVGISWLLYFMGWDGTLSRMEGGILLGGILAYTCYVYRVALTESASIEQEYEEFVGTAYDSIKKDIFLIVIGLTALIAGAHFLVHSAIYIARVVGISELVIGLTVIAVGTSLPELATSMIAAVRKESDISVGNVLGSNIFNILAVLGIAAIIQPLQVNAASLIVDIPAMLLFCIFLIPLITWKFVLTRGQGLLLLIGYGIYVLWLFK
ncbi:MAG: sodium:calcium antiporter [Candidatus Brocadia sp. AMX2]|uniref:CaCA family Na(+)/Ca(+) antiporter n=1 Tax=Candidatus Brocadia sinica JPN1 TaxID=1197129 RepID=A0ABQ0JYG6_9BACT|nr:MULTISPECIES: calcium/sodium antiporter [Brocadia]KXK25219.1 MAG: Ca2+/Na+ antiporter [Candidatus Brocadia sinica]MBC6932869.1 sodium:calcium antiporter [Candidatus Brocadia sp.]MBL1167645.1 sodium:calcium antiporter [Candidatus Brocadia sp. AMX1]NOG40463.1 calcium/sodium antiporter [Planctomycetota bacterium]KAA0242106.1 MAG: calcium/sodium antiporter [Candidatus Brocadia sp. AMX2]